VVQVELPTGTVTLLFTDIEGSTRLLRSLGDDYGAVLRAHRTILRDAVGRHGGVEFGTEGDACFLAFPASAAALAAAAEAQHALAADDVAQGRVMTFDQALDSAAAWADQRRTHAT
jgi:class 3 adenylate cyclase